MAKYKAQTTHIRIKDKLEVIVERFEGGIFVVRNLKGKALASYQKSEMAIFNKRYKSIRANRG